MPVILAQGRLSPMGQFGLYTENSRVAYAKDYASTYLPYLLKGPHEFYMLPTKSKPDAGLVEWLTGKGARC